MRANDQTSQIGISAELMFSEFSRHFNTNEQLTKNKNTFATADLTFGNSPARLEESSDASRTDTFDGEKSTDIESDLSREDSDSSQRIDASDVEFKGPNTLEERLFARTSPEITNSMVAQDPQIDFSGDNATYNSNKIRIGDVTIEADIVENSKAEALKRDVFAKIEKKILNSEPIATQDIKPLCDYKDLDLDRFNMSLYFDDKNLFVTGVDPSCNEKVTIYIIKEQQFVSQEPIFEKINPLHNQHINSAKTSQDSNVDLNINHSSYSPQLKRIHVVKDGIVLDNPLVEEGRYVTDDEENHLKNRLEKLRSELAKIHEDSEPEDLSIFENKGLPIELESKTREMDIAENSTANPDPQVTGPAGSRSILPRLRRPGDRRTGDKGL